MIQTAEITEQTVEELVAEALNKIPLYTAEWTNFNPSEPGITILEQLAGAIVLQQQFIGRMASGVQKELLALAGFQASDLKCAKVLVKAEQVSEDMLIYENQQFCCGELVFEVPQNTMIAAAKLVGVYSRRNETVKSCDSIRHPELPLAEEPFGTKPKAGNAIYFVFDRPFPIGREVIAYVKSGQETKRNAPQAGSNCPFALLEWSYYTSGGFTELPCGDETYGLLLDGELRFQLPEIPGAVYHELPQMGYVIRGKVRAADYDLPPKLQSVCFGLFEIRQQQAKSICRSFSAYEPIHLHGKLLEEPYLQVFGRGQQERHCRLYTQGRHYNLEKKADGSVEIYFLQSELEYPATVWVAAYSEEIMRRRDLGCICGYDNQRLELPVSNIVPETFSLIARLTDDNGGEYYDIIQPDRSSEGDLCYTFTDDGNIYIRAAGDYLGAHVYLGGLNVTSGAEGNILTGNRLEAPGLAEAAAFWNPAPGHGGCDKETLSQVRQRFREDMNKSYTVTLAADYERVVKQTPGLCIDKVKAFCRKENHVDIAVKPYGTEAFPKLSKAYHEILYQHLEQYRLLSTAICILEPVYVPIDASGSIYVKKHYENCREQITEVLERRLDYINGTQQFGELLSFTEIFRELEALACVEFIYELSFSSPNTGYAAHQGADIKPGENCLCYPGRIQLQIHTYGS